MVLTGTRLHAGSSKAELPVRVWFGLKGGGVVDGGRRTVLLTHSAVVEVTASLQRGRTLQKKTPTRTRTVLLSLTRQSESLGPVHPAAHCMWQQSLGREPLHRWQPDAQLLRVTLNEKDRSGLSAALQPTGLVSAATGTHRSGSPVQRLPNSLSNTQRNSWGLHRKKSATNKAADTDLETEQFEKSQQFVSGTRK